MINELQEYIKISVAAVGGPDSDEGKEMERLLLERAGTPDLPAVIEPPSDQPQVEESLMGEALEGLFAQQFQRSNELP